MYYGNKTHIIQYSVLFAGLCMVVQPIACFSVKEGLQTLYGKLPQSPTSKQGIYGLVLVVGGAALAALFLAHRWYTSRQQPEKTGEAGAPAVQPIMSEQDKEAEKIFGTLYALYESNKTWLDYSIVDRERTSPNLYHYLSVKTEWKIANFSDFMQNMKSKQDAKSLICAVLHSEIDKLKEITSQTNDTRDAQDKLSQLRTLLGCEKAEALTSYPAEVKIAAEDVVVASGEEPRTIEAVLAKLNDIYLRYETWRIYTSGQAAEDSFYSYLAQLCKIKSVSDDSVKVILNAIARNDQNIKQCFCRVLQLEANSLNSLGDTEEGYADIPQATKLISQLIKLLVCEKIAELALDPVPVVSPAVSAAPEETQQTIQGILARLNEIYLKYETWRSYGVPGQRPQQADNFYSYLAKQCAIEGEKAAFENKILAAMAKNNTEIKQCFCRVLSKENQTLGWLSEAAEGYEAIPEAQQLLSQLIKLLECET